MSQIFKECQSCGMPLKRDEQGGGSNADGSKSTVYCSHCYVDGRFVDPTISMEQMREKVKAKLIDFGIPSFLCWIFTRKTARLLRWRVN